MHRTPAILLAALTPLTLAVGCASPPDSVEDGDKSGGFTYGVSLYASGDTFAATMLEAAEAEAAKLGDEIIITTDGQFDSQKQSNDVQDIIARRPDAILLAAGDTAQATTWVDQAVEANIPIFDLFNAIDHFGPPLYEGVAAGIQVDEKASGAAAGSIAAEVLAPGDKAGVVLGAPGFAEVDDRRAGFTEAVRAAGDFEVMASPNGDWTAEHGQAACEDLIGANPDLAVIYVMSDSMSVGCLKASNLGDVQVIGNAGSTEGLTNVERGAMLGTTCYGPSDIARRMVQIAHAVLAGDEEKQGTLELVEPFAVTKENVADCPKEW